MKALSVILRGLVGCITVVSILEVCARVDDALTYGAPMWEPYNRRILEMQDAIGPRGRPNARFRKWQLNSLGYRGPELVSGTVRIACIGASETFGLYEAAGQEWPRQLEQELNERTGRNVFQVVNVAVAGQSVATSILRVPEIVDAIHPSYALIYPSTAFYIAPPPLREGPAPDKPVRVDAGPARAPLELRIIERVRNLSKQALPPVVQTTLRRREIEAAASRQAVMDRVPEENVIRFRTDLAKLVTALRDNGVEPILVTHATVFGSAVSDSTRDYLTAWRMFYPMLREEGFLDMERRMNDAIRELGRRERLVVIDVTGQIPPGREYFADFVHFTTAGAAVMAARVADGLLPVVGPRLRPDSGNSLRPR